MVRTSYLVQGFDDLIDLLLGQGQAHRRADKDHVLVPILHGRTSFFYLFESILVLSRT